MSHTIRLALALHNHQPVGNFDGVFEQAYEDSYRPFLDVFDHYPTLKIGLHTSGSLMEWLAQRHPRYLDRLGELVAAGRVEIIGGAFYEPILSMIPRRDRAGQIISYSRWLEDRFDTKIRGMWVPERVWEPSFTSDLAQAGIQYTLLDDFHFKSAGLTEGQLHSYYVTEDDGHLLAVFPGSERLRYLIPFANPQDTIDYLAGIAKERPGSIVVFGDDGEKFGTWPQTHKHVYLDGWLKRFLDLLVENQDWIKVTTLAEAVENIPPAGKIYLSNGSYREMTEWALPADRLYEYEQLKHEMSHDSRWPAIARLVQGGFWRNFKIKYPESDEMYTRMLAISQRLAAAEAADHDAERLEEARAELYRGQCNCAYWHGAFGGIYLPHLRNAVYQHLIAADNLLDKAAGRTAPWVEATATDLNLDAHQEISLANDKLVALISPYLGGQVYELDVRAICHNLLATLSRRPEAYHHKVLTAGNSGNSNVGSIHDQIIFKQPGLGERLGYDAYSRKSLIDHFYDARATLTDIASGQAAELGDFTQSIFEARLRRSAQRIQIQLSRQGIAGATPVKITKGITLAAGSSALEIAYLLEGLPRDESLHFGVEFNFSGLPSGCDDRYFHDGDGRRLGHLGRQLDLENAPAVGLTDEWLGIDVVLRLSYPANIWTFPIETVSQSEAGFELVHQSVVVLPHWHVRADEYGRWSVTMNLAIDTSRAASHIEPAIVAAAS